MFELHGKTLLVRETALPQEMIHPGTAKYGIVEDFDEDYFAQAGVNDTLAAKVNAAWSDRLTNDGVRIFFDPDKAKETPGANDAVIRYFVSLDGVLAFHTLDVTEPAERPAQEQVGGAE